MKHLYLCMIMISLSVSEVSAQFYYRDIISTNQANEEMGLYRKAGVKNVKIKSYEADGLESEDFFCEKRINKDFSKATLYTRTGKMGQSLMIANYNSKGLLIRSYDSSETVITSTDFKYDNQNKLIGTLSHSRSSDDDYLTDLTEEHVYSYGATGILSSMIKVKNLTDTLKVLFSSDEKNNIAIEKETRNGSKYYYYYDEFGRLTDLVHANEYKQKMIADYVFEYDEQGNISKMTTSEDTNDNFTYWRYDYNANGLKSTEKIYGTNGKLVGKVIYEYK